MEHRYQIQANDHPVFELGDIEPTLAFIRALHDEQPEARILVKSVSGNEHGLGVMYDSGFRDGLNTMVFTGSHTNTAVKAAYDLGWLHGQKARLTGATGALR